jgi:ABC-type uncharacterized transport system substrate-binding protein
MRRRDLLVGLAAGSLPLAAPGEGKPPVVAILDSRGANPLAVEQVRKGLGEAGYREGQSVTVQYRGTDGHYDRLPSLAAELVHERVSVIVTLSPPPTHAAKAATATIPVVFLIGYDPVKLGLVASLNRPGGNVTGISMLGAGLVAKRLQILRELVPGASRIGLLVNASNPDLAKSQSDEVRAAADGLSVEVVQARSEPGTGGRV